MLRSTYSKLPGFVNLSPQTCLEAGCAAVTEISKRLPACGQLPAAFKVYHTFACSEQIPRVLIEKISVRSMKRKARFRNRCCKISVAWNLKAALLNMLVHNSILWNFSKTMLALTPRLAKFLLRPLRHRMDGISLSHASYPIDQMSTCWT